MTTQQSVQNKGSDTGHQEELNEMRKLVDNLKTEVKTLQEQLEKKSQNDTEVQLTNLVCI